jgi:hypothetical protein
MPTYEPRVAITMREWATFAGKMKFSCKPDALCVNHDETQSTVSRELLKQQSSHFDISKLETCETTSEGLDGWETVSGKP